MSEIENLFKKALEDVKQKNPTTSEKLKLYGLYKQINNGDCNTSRPWSYQLEAAAKWDAWNTEKGKDKTKCMNDYIVLVASL